MFPASAFTREWINRQRATLGRCDPAILEKCVHALTLVEYLVESGLPFVFKGGTSLLLHLPEVRRLSRDIDIVCGRPRADVNVVIGVIGRRSPFLRWEEDDRGARGLPQRRHFQLFYRSVLAGSTEQEVVLDVVEETREVHTIVTRPIRTTFLEPEREVFVRVPTSESLLGDKLTAFAPATTGVPFFTSRGSDQRQQVAKQLFDVGVLFDAAGDFGAVASAYDAVSSQESEYRPSRPTRNMALEDTWNTCLALTASRKAQLAAYPDHVHLHDGLDKMRGHLTSPTYLNGREARRRLAAKAALLVAHLRAGQAFDFENGRYTGTQQQLDVVRSSTLQNTSLAWLDGTKAVNPEAYFYWHQAITLFA